MYFVFDWTLPAHGVGVSYFWRLWAWLVTDLKILKNYMGGAGNYRPIGFVAFNIRNKMFCKWAGAGTKLQAMGWIYPWIIPIGPISNSPVWAFIGISGDPTGPIYHLWSIPTLARISPSSLTSTKIIALIKPFNSKRKMKSLTGVISGLTKYAFEISHTCLVPKLKFIEVDLQGLE